MRDERYKALLKEGEGYDIIDIKNIQNASADYNILKLEGAGIFDDNGRFIKDVFKMPEFKGELDDARYIHYIDGGDILKNAGSYVNYGANCKFVARNMPGVIDIKDVRYISDNDLERFLCKDVSALENKYENITFKRYKAPYDTKQWKLNKADFIKRDIILGGDTFNTDIIDNFIKNEPKMLKDTRLELLRRKAAHTKVKKVWCLDIDIKALNKDPFLKDLKEAEEAGEEEEINKNKKAIEDIERFLKEYEDEYNVKGLGDIREDIVKRFKDCSLYSGKSKGKGAHIWFVFDDDIEKILETLYGKVIKYENKDGVLYTIKEPELTDAQVKENIRRKKAHKNKTADNKLILLEPKREVEFNETEDWSKRKEISEGVYQEVMKSLWKEKIGIDPVVGLFDPVSTKMAQYFVQGSKSHFGGVNKKAIKIKDELIKALINGEGIKVEKKAKSVEIKIKESIVKEKMFLERIEEKDLLSILKSVKADNQAGMLGFLHPTRKAVCYWLVGFKNRLKGKQYKKNDFIMLYIMLCFFFKNIKRTSITIGEYKDVYDHLKAFDIQSIKSQDWRARNIEGALEIMIKEKNMAKKAFNALNVVKTWSMVPKYTRSIIDILLSVDVKISTSILKKYKEKKPLEWETIEVEETPVGLDRRGQKYSKEYNEDFLDGEYLKAEIFDKILSDNKDNKDIVFKAETGIGKTTSIVKWLIKKVGDDILCDFNKSYNEAIEGFNYKEESDILTKIKEYEYKGKEPHAFITPVNIICEQTIQSFDDVKEKAIETLIEESSVFKSIQNDIEILVNKDKEYEKKRVFDLIYDALDKNITASGVYGQGAKYNGISPIIITNIQSLNDKFEKGLNIKYGYVFYDECHKVIDNASIDEGQKEPLKRVNAGQRIWVSATPEPFIVPGGDEYFYVNIKKEKELKPLYCDLFNKKAIEKIKLDILDKKSKNEGKFIIYVNDMRLMNELKDNINNDNRLYDLDFKAVQGGVQGKNCPILRDIKRENILKDNILTTSVMADGVNILNDDILGFYIIGNTYTKPMEMVQLCSRVRKGVVDGNINYFVRKPANNHIINDINILKRDFKIDKETYEAICRIYKKKGTKVEDYESSFIYHKGAPMVNYDRLLNYIDNKYYGEVSRYNHVEDLSRDFDVKGGNYNDLEVEEDRQVSLTSKINYNIFKKIIKAYYKENDNNKYINNFRVYVKSDDLLNKGYDFGETLKVVKEEKNYGVKNNPVVKSISFDNDDIKNDNILWLKENEKELVKKEKELREFMYWLDNEPIIKQSIGDDKMVDKYSVLEYFMRVGLCSFNRAKDNLKTAFIVENIDNINNNMFNNAPLWSLEYILIKRFIDLEKANDGVILSNIKNKYDITGLLNEKSGKMKQTYGALLKTKEGQKICIDIWTKRAHKKVGLYHKYFNKGIFRKRKKKIGDEDVSRFVLYYRYFNNKVRVETLFKKITKEETMGQKEDNNRQYINIGKKKEKKKWQTPAIREIDKEEGVKLIVSK